MREFRIAQQPIFHMVTVKEERIDYVVVVLNRGDGFGPFDIFATLVVPLHPFYLVFPHGRSSSPGAQEFWFLLTCMAAGRPVSAERHGDQGARPLGWPSLQRRCWPLCLSRYRSCPTAFCRNQPPKADANAACTVNGLPATVAAAFSRRRSPGHPRPAPPRQLPRSATVGTRLRVPPPVVLRS